MGVYVIPAKGGISADPASVAAGAIPAFAGMTKVFRAPSTALRAVPLPVPGRTF